MRPRATTRTPRDEPAQRAGAPPLLPLFGAPPSLDFRWSCDDCAHFVPELARCAHGYPTAPHRRDAPAPTFCKEYELA